MRACRNTAALGHTAVDAHVTQRLEWRSCRILHESIMQSSFSFTCRVCGQTHVGQPGFEFAVPYHYFNLSDEQKSSIAQIDSDFCKIDHGHQVDHFVRGVLEVPVQGTELMFSWLVWVAVDAQTFAEHQTRLTAPGVDVVRSGWLSNQLPGYPDTLGLLLNVHPRPHGLRPALILQRTATQATHPLLHDQYGGFSQDRAQTIAEHLVHGTGQVAPADGAQ